MFPQNLTLIPITEKLPNNNQDVIAWNGIRLVAAKYVIIKRLSGNNLSESEIIDVGDFQTEKYVSEGDRSLVTYWRNITHWMPATL